MNSIQKLWAELAELEQRMARETRRGEINAATCCRHWEIIDVLLALARAGRHHV